MNHPVRSFWRDVVQVFTYVIDESVLKIFGNVLDVGEKNFHLIWEKEAQNVDCSIGKMNEKFLAPVAVSSKS